MLLMLLLTHYVSDFLLQSREVAKKKSTEVKFLFEHTLTIFLLFLLVTVTFAFARNIDEHGLIKDVVLISLKNALMFCFLNSVFHAIIDGTTWNLYKSYWSKKLIDEEKLKSFKFWEDKLFFDTIGIDQFLHISTIVILYEVYIK